MYKFFTLLNKVAKKYEKLFTIFFIGGLSLAISAAQLLVASSQVAMNETMARYNSYKTYPQVEVVRLSDEKDTVKIVNQVGEWFDLQSEIITVLYAQTNSNLGFRDQSFIVKPIRSEFFKKEEKGKNTILVSTSYKSYEEWKAYQYDFALRNSTESMSAAIHYGTYIRLGYRNIYGELSNRYFGLSKPTMSARESAEYETIFATAFTDKKYQMVLDGQDVNKVLESWVKKGE